MWTPTYGSAITFTALTFSVGCEITSFTVAGAPGSNPTYSVFSSRAIIPLTSVTYTQVPACGYTFTNSFGHTIPAGTATSIIFAGTTVVPSFEIYTTTPAHAANYAVSLTNTITVGSGQGQGATTSFTPSNVDITIEVSDPCPASTISSITFSPNAISVVDGSSATAEFSIPGDTVDTANSLTGLCGTKTYTLTNNSGGASVSAWATVTDSSVTAGDKTLTINTLNYPSEITTATLAITIDVLVKYANYAGNAGTTTQIVVTITKATCSCAAMAWSAPTVSVAAVSLNGSITLATTQSASEPYFPPPVSSDAAKATDAAFNQCWADGNACTTAGTYSALNVKYDAGDGNGIVAIPGGWLAWSDANQ